MESLPPEVVSNGISENAKAPGDDALGRLKADLEGYRQILLPLNKVLEWDESHYPGVIVGVITLIFSIIWWLQPSVLTCFSLLGLLLCLIDFVVPTVTAYFFTSTEWTALEDKQFETICSRLLNAREHVSNIVTALADLKNEKPKVYLLVMMGIFACTAWIGSLIDNLMLTYLLVVFLVLVPGLRKHGILQKATALAKEQALALVAKIKEAREKAAGPKKKAK